MSISRVIFVVAMTTGLAQSAHADWDGTYKSTTTIGSYLHSEVDVVSGLSVTGSHSFTDGTNAGSFDWIGALIPNSPNTANLIGSGIIHNLGDRAFVITSGGLYLDGSINAYTLYWGATDPIFGGIGGTAYLASPVPEPTTALMLFYGLALVGTVFRGAIRKGAIQH